MSGMSRVEIARQTVAELATRFERSVGMMHKVCAPVSSIGKRGRANLYDPAAIESLLADKTKRKTKSSEVKELERQKLELQCRKLEVEINEKLGKLIPVDDVRRFVETHTSTVALLAQRLGGELAPQLQDVSVAQAEKVINAAGEELIAELRRMPWDD